MANGENIISAAEFSRLMFTVSMTIQNFPHLRSLIFHYIPDMKNFNFEFHEIPDVSMICTNRTAEG